ncbi:alpha/beta fold hydrolase [Alkalicoccus daliensis]|uniref:Pimeloyl-ACP methyl ester carboxylesterase n=1 Tax=Alkalicoccus daliensis TaxID=745820 RepID=A0A1H0CPR0_9BACI|nr:alpha/beta hydrolase [Alkalicoccus daliensis]SDN59854.1 Pimeloyl-ACP methyl ester carboxylesterase [Alkalicoccus daliensis]
MTAGTEIIHKKIIIDQVEIHCEAAVNEKPALLLVHGFMSSTFTFRKVIPMLAEHFSVVAIDLPGFGQSEKSVSFIYSYENYARIVLKAMDYFQFDKVSLIGHSMGGQIALNAARLAPDRIEKLVLLGSSGYLNKAKKYMVLSTYLPFFDKYIYYYIQKRGVKSALENVLFDSSNVTTDLIHQFGEPLKDRNMYKALVRLLRYREGDLSSEQLQQIHTPSLLIWGEEDKVVRPQVGRRLAKDLPGAEFITFQQAGHLITEERPKEVFEKILQFLGEGKELEHAFGQV